MLGTRRLIVICRNSTVGDVFRKIMGDVPLAYVETAGGFRVSEDDVVAVGKNDVGSQLDVLLHCLYWRRSCPLRWGGIELALDLSI